MLVATAHTPGFDDALGFIPGLKDVVVAAQIYDRELKEAQQAEAAGTAPAGTAERVTARIRVLMGRPQQGDEAAFTAQEKEFMRVLDAGFHEIPATVKPGENPYVEELRRVTLARDWDSLFKYVPYDVWGSPLASRFNPRGIQIGKFSFNWGPNGRPVYVPFSPADIRRFFNSKHLRVSHFEYECTQDQKDALTKSYTEKQQASAQQFPASNWRHVAEWYPGMSLCDRPQKSLWVRMRKKIYIAVAIVAAVYLGPIVMSKIGGMLGGGATGGAAGATAGAGAATGATTVSAAVGTGAAAGAGATTAGTLATAAAKASAFLTTVQKGVDYYNKASTINAMVKGDVPPPPVSITGSSFTEWGVNVAKDLAVKEIKEEAGEYFAEKLTEKEEALMRAELEALQRQLAALVPAGTPIEPDPRLQPEIRQKITEMQDIERQRETNIGAILLAAAIPTVLLLAA